ncbi:DUF2284 domain-containing protein [bacterium]|nr:DUF2284 domain-containing protein [bacterium]MBU1982992.1 DUF2284 domain-containing protein [bacterium]
MKDRTELEALFAKQGYADYKWIRPQDIVVAEWVRMKCTFGCDEYGRNACCPPNTPSVDACRRFFDEYNSIAIFRFAKQVDKPEDRRPWARQVNDGLVELEREVFLSGHEKAFVLFMDSCRVCTECVPGRAECKNPQAARPGPEAMAVDVFSTARNCGYPIEVLADYTQTMNRYAFLLIE